MKTNEIFIYGKKAIYDSVENSLDIKVVYIIDNDKKMINFLKESSINYEIKNKDFFNKMSNSKELNHQNTIAVLKNINYSIGLTEALNILKRKTEQAVLILDSIEDPRNFGSILRNCAAFGVEFVFIKNKNQASVNELVIKTSQGGINYLKICEVPNITRLLEELKKINFWIYASTLSEDSVDFESLDYSGNKALIVGNENKGISPLVQKNSDFKIHINMEKTIQSLNVSVATAILLQRFNKK